MADDDDLQNDSLHDRTASAQFENEAFEATLDGFPVHKDHDGLRARLPIEILASQFIDEHRSGSNPSVEQYATTYKKLADEIRDLFPAMLAMEQLKSDEEATMLRDQVRGEFNIKELGGCRIRGEVGRGGMGVVFEAIEKRTRRKVAVKLLPWPSEAVPRWRERFREEARLSARLMHKNIVPIYSFGEEDGYCYMLLRFIDGVSLDRVLDSLNENDGVADFDEVKAKALGIEAAAIPEATKINRRITSTSWRMFARIGVQACSALQHAHESGTLHNDIKPGNLLLDTSGKTWVTDFGLANVLEPETAQDDQRVTGTLRYMAPERFEGKSDPRTDIYSLGATLYELITLQPMFDAETNKALMDKVINRRPLRPCDIESTIPRDLEAIVVRAIDADADYRYQTAVEMKADLQRFMDGEGVDRSRRSRISDVVTRWRFRK